MPLRKLSKSISSEDILELLEQLGFYVENVTATDGDWVIKHKTKDAMHGKNYITVPRYNVISPDLVKQVLYLISDKFDISNEQIMKSGWKLFSL